MVESIKKNSVLHNQYKVFRVVLHFRAVTSIIGPLVKQLYCAFRNPQTSVDLWLADIARPVTHIMLMLPGDTATFPFLWQAQFFIALTDKYRLTIWKWLLLSFFKIKYKLHLHKWHWVFDPVLSLISSYHHYCISTEMHTCITEISR